MKTLVFQHEGKRTVLCEESDSDGVGFVQGKDYVKFTWDEAIRVRDWLQMAIAERTDRAADSATPPP